MNKEREVLKMALVVLKSYATAYDDGDEAIAAIKEVLTQPEQEPVRREQKMFMDEQEFYTTPPQRTWVGLTDAEKLVSNQMWRVMDADGFIKAIEAKLKEKNT